MIIQKTDNCFIVSSETIGFQQECNNVRKKKLYIRCIVLSQDNVDVIIMQLKGNSQENCAIDSL